MLNKNDVVRLSVSGMTSQGSGVGKTSDGFTVFVQNAAPGDVLDVVVIKAKKTYAIGKILKVISPSKNRIEPDCEAFTRCGGCVYRHISYSSELEIKQQYVEDSLKRIGGFSNINVMPIVGADLQESYRNKAQLPLSLTSDGKIAAGYYAFHSHRVIDCDNCRLHPNIFNDIITFSKNFFETKNISVYDESNNCGLLRHLFLRIAKASGQIMVCVVINGENLPFEKEFVCMITEQFPQICSIALNFNTEITNVILGDKTKIIFGSSFIEDALFGLKFLLSPPSFYQVNPEQTEKLYSVARKYAALCKDNVLLDLFCGVGTIGLCMARDCKRLVGVEVVEQAVENARENAQLNKIDNAEFICGDASFAAAELEKKRLLPDVVVIDPPRKGCAPELIKTIAQMSPERVVYVSCDPATLARDLKTFFELGYSCLEVTPVDMFPRTAHVECVVLISKVD